MLTFLVQNMLDYAQIKAGKFRKSSEKFDVREKVDLVMNIQKLEASQKGLYLEAIYDLDDF